MRRPILLAGVLLLIAVALSFLFQQEVPFANPAEEDPAAGAGTEAAASLPAPADPPPAAQDPGIGRTEAPIEPGTVPAAADASYLGPWLNLEVVQGTAALPAPFARVTLLTPEQEQQEELMMLFLTGITVPDLLSSQGVEYATDGAGKTRVPMPFEHGLIAAELGDGFVLVEWDPASDARAQDRDLRLALQPASSIDVLVVNGAGQILVGAPVSIRFGDENFQMDFLRDHTGTDGIARMKHLPAFLASFTPGMNMPCSVALVSPLPEPVSAPLDLANLPETPIKLVMPETGRLEVEARRADGTFVEDGQIVFLARPRERPEDDDDFFVPGLPGFDSIAVHVIGGVATFAYVGLGMELEATAVFPDALESSSIRGHGPERAGETMRWTLKESLDFPILTGRLLASDGTPLAKRIAEFRIPDQENEFGMERSRRVTTAADGSFRFPMRSNEMIPRAQAAEFMILGKGADGALLARFEIPPLSPGENSVGDLRTRAAPVLAAGRVLGADDQPTAGATVNKMLWMQWDEDDPSNGEWMDDYGNEVACDEDGSFVIYGDPPADGLRLVAEAPSHLRQELSASPGSRDLTIRLAAGATVRGRLLADPGTPLDEIVVTLLLPGVGFEEEERHWASIDSSDGGFTFTGLRPSVGMLTMSAGWIADQASPFVIIDGIQIEPGAEQDARLDPIDVRGRLHAYRVKVRNADGAMVSEFQVWPEEASESKFHSLNGEVTVMSAQLLTRLVIQASGFRSQMVDAVMPLTEVVLSRGPEILLQVPPASARFDDLILGVQLARVEENMGWSNQPRGFFAEDGTLRLHVSEPGAYSVIFLAEQGRVPNPDDWGFTWIPPEEGLDYQTFTIADVAGAQIVPITPPTRAAIAAAFAENKR